MATNRFLVAFIVADLVIIGLLAGAWAWRSKQVARAGAGAPRVVAVTEVSAAGSASPLSANGVVVPARLVHVTIPTSLEAQVARVAVDQGAQVSQGDVLAELDPVRPESNAAVNQAAIQEAQAKLELARHPYTKEQLRQKRLEEEQARQAMREASEKLSLLRSGALPNDVAIAQDGVEAARARLELARKRHNDNTALFAKDLIARAEVDETQTELITAQKALDQAQKRVAGLQQGPRDEEVQAAEARFQQARLAYEIAREANAEMRRGARPADVARAEAVVREQRARLDTENRANSRYTVRAPLAGVVLARNISPGEIAPHGASRGDERTAESTRSLFVIADTSSVEFRVDVDVAHYHAVREGQKVQVQIQSLPGRSFAGTIVRKNPLVLTPVDGATPPSFPIWVRLPNPSRTLVPGQAGVALLEPAGGAPPGMLVPRSAFKTFAQANATVLVVQDGALASREIRYDPTGDVEVRVLEGLSPGDRVVVSNVKDLVPGMKVETITAFRGK